MKITFFCKTEDHTALKHNLFYVQDIDILKSIDSNLVIATRWSQIDYKADVIFVWWWTYAFIPVIIGRLLGKRVIITGTFNYDAPKSPNNFNSRPLWQKALIWFSLKFASKNILVSEREYDIFKDKFKMTNIKYIPHGVYVSNYKPNYHRDSNFLLTISWLEQHNMIRKCIYQTVDALSILRKRGSNLKLVIAGRRGDAVTELQNYIDQHGLTEHVNVMVDITEDQKINLLSTCKLYLQPSIYEGFGVAIAEAMSCGCTIVTSEAGEVPNVVGDTAYVLEETNPNTISSAISELLSEPETYNSLQLKARDRVVNLFSVERRKREIIELLEINR